MSSQRPPAEAVAAAFAPHGMTSVTADEVVLEAYCLCNRELLLRIIRTPGGLLVLQRSHLRPLAKNLREKGSLWPGGERFDPRIISDAEAGRTEHGLGAVGWDEGAWWFDAHAGGALQCRCKRDRWYWLPLARLSMERYIAAGNARRRFEWPRDAVLDQDQYKEQILLQHRPMQLAELERRRLARSPLPTSDADEV